MNKSRTLDAPTPTYISTNAEPDNEKNGTFASPAPRVDLTIGSTGEKVRQIQEELARISRSYPAIPTVTPDGIYGPATREAVEVFQRVFGLPVTGVIDYRTWYKISEIYVAVSRIAELV